MVPIFRAFFVTLLMSGCNCHSDRPDPAKASASAPPTTAPRCRFPSTDVSFTLGRGEASSLQEGAGEEGPLDLPFAVELGAARPTVDGFALPAIEERNGTSHAVLVLLGKEAEGAAIVDLGEVHGSALPGVVAPAQNELVVAFVDGSASGSTLRLASVTSKARPPAVHFGQDIPQGNDESAVFDLELSGGEGLVVWDEWKNDQNISVVMAQAVSASELSRDAEPFVISPPKVDAESPHLASRGDGLWVAWLENVGGRPHDEKKRAKVSGEESEEAASWVFGPRRVVVAPATSKGGPVSKPIAATPEEGHVLAFDLIALPNGGALVVWRDDTTSPATPGGRLLSAEIHPDGSVDRRVIAEDDIGAGVPLLFADPKDGRTAWLTFSGHTDTIRLAAISSSGDVLGSITEESALHGAVPLAASDSHLLTARPRGKSVELRTAVCNP